MAKKTNLLGNLNISNIDELNKTENKNEILDYISFDFDADKETIDFLKEQTYNLHMTMSKSYTKLGKIFKETQEKLSGSNQYNGLFYKWFKSLDFSNDFVYKLINRYNLLIRFSDKQNLIESLPITLSYEISKEKCPDILRDKVLNGEIKTLKSFIELKKNLLEEISEEKNIEKIPIDLDVFQHKIEEFERFNLKLKSEDIKMLEEEKKEQVMEAIEKFEKTLERILK